MPNKCYPAWWRGYTAADRMEESNAWRNPVDLINILETTFTVLSETIETGQQVRAGGHVWVREADVIPVLHGDDPQLYRGYFAASTARRGNSG